MCELAQSAAECVVLAVVEWVGEVVAAADRGFTVVEPVGLVGYQVDFAQEAGFVVLEFADHVGEEI